MKLRGAWGHEAQALAQLHAAAFDHAWSAAEIAQLLDGPSGFALVRRTGGVTPSGLRKMAG